MIDACEISKPAPKMSTNTARRIIERAIDGADPWSVEVRDAKEALDAIGWPADSPLLRALGRRRREALTDQHESHNEGGTEDWSRLTAPPVSVEVIGWALFGGIAWALLGVWFLA